MINKKTLALLFLATSTLSFASKSQEYDPEQNPKNTTLYCQPYRQDATTPETAQPSMIVLNYSQKSTAEESLRSFRNSQISTHYIIDKDGKFYKGISEQLEEVPTENGTPHIDPEYIKLRAFHTGPGYWGTYEQVINSINTHSIGILFVNEASNQNTNPNFAIGDPDNSTQWVPYTPEQKIAFVMLAQALKTRYNIANKDIVGYNEVRTNNDILNVGGGPGPLFDWKNAAENGVGLYHNLTEEELTNPSKVEKLANAPEVPVKCLQRYLDAWGYKVPQTGELNKQTEQAMQQFIIHHDPYQFPPNITRTTRIIKNLLTQADADAQQQNIASK